MTEQLYHQQPAPMEAQAAVLACRPSKTGFEVLLDLTPLYPEGGGQLSDTGWLDDAPVSYVFDKDGEIWHCTDRAFPEGAKVTARVEPLGRRDHSVQHTAEHMLSGLANRLFGAVNVGFHMAEEYVSLDLDLPLSPEQVEQLECAANEIAARNVPLETKVFTMEELEHVTLRKRAQGLEGEIRVVFIPGADSCTCCGTHCASTAEVGLIKITAADHYKGGTRIFFLAGLRALRDYQQKHAALDGIARRFSVKPLDAAEAVARQGQELNDCRRVARERTQALMELKAKELLAKAEPVKGIKPLAVTWEGLNANEMKAFLDSLCKREKTAAMLFVPEGDTLRYACARSGGVNLSMRDLCAAMNAALGGKGGGREEFAQGSAKAAPGQREAAEQLEHYLKTLLKQ